VARGRRHALLERGGDLAGEGVVWLDAAPLSKMRPGKLGVDQEIQLGVPRRQRNVTGPTSIVQ